MEVIFIVKLDKKTAKIKLKNVQPNSLDKNHSIKQARQLIL